MRAHRHASGAAFLQHARDWLLQDEAQYNLMLHLGAVLGNATLPEGAYLCTVEEDGALVGCALRTPPRKLLLTHMPDTAVRAVIDDIDAAGITLPSVMAPHGTARQFALAWCERRGCKVREGMHHRLYELDRVVPPARPAPGYMRWAGPDDLALAREWIAQFAIDALAEELDSRINIDARVQGGELALWEDGGVRAMAGYSGYSPNGVRIGYVYTPHDWRGRGYASTLVAELSRTALAAGARFCFLYTDLANPTSNSIYREIGYRSAGDVIDIHFSGDRGMTGDEG